MNLFEFRTEFQPLSSSPPPSPSQVKDFEMRDMCDISLSRKGTVTCGFCLDSQSVEEIKPFPCNCISRHVHESCLRRWIENKPEPKYTCEVCNEPYRMETTLNVQQSNVSNVQEAQQPRTTHVKQVCVFSSFLIFIGILLLFLFYPFPVYDCIDPSDTVMCCYTSHHVSNVSNIQPGQLITVYEDDGRTIKNLEIVDYIQCVRDKTRMIQVGFLNEKHFINNECDKDKDKYKYTPPILKLKNGLLDIDVHVGDVTPACYNANRYLMRDAIYEKIYFSGFIVAIVFLTFVPVCCLTYVYCVVCQNM
jgi:RING-variant domain